MTDRRVHSAHHAMEQTRPGAETNAQSEPSGHPDCLEARGKGGKQTRVHVLMYGQLIKFIVIYG